MIDRDPQAVQTDLIAGLCSPWSAREIYRVVWDPARERVDLAATEALRAATRQARIQRGQPYDAFESSWLTRRPPAEIMNLYGSWPDARPLAPAFRP